MVKTPVGVLASGRGSNLLAILRAAEDPDYPGRVALVLSDREDAPALEHAREADVDAIYVAPGKIRTRASTEAEERMATELRERGVEIVALAGFMRILSSRFLDAFPRRVINIHPSLLPAFPGLDAQRQAFDHGSLISGCTTHIVDKGIDTGPILLQSAVAVEEGDTAESLAARILNEEHELYPKTIRMLLEKNLTIKGRRAVWREKERAKP